MNIQYKNILVGIGASAILLTSGLVFVKSTNLVNNEEDLTALSFFSNSRNNTPKKSADPVPVVKDSMVSVNTNNSCGLSTEWSGFNYPTDLTLDKQGNIYMVSRDDNVVIIDSQGNKKTFGSPGSGNGQFNDPHSITIDSKGNMYIEDHYKILPGGDVVYRMQIFDPQGNYLRSFDSLSLSTTTYTVNNDVYLVVATLDNLIYKMKNPELPSSQFVPFTDYSNFQDQYSKIADLTTDDTNLYVLDGKRRKIITFNFDGTVSIPEWGKHSQFSYDPDDFPDDGFSFPGSIAVNDKHIYIGDASSNRIYAFDKKTRKFISSFRGKYGDINPLTYVTSLNVDSNGNLYFVDTLGKIYMYGTKCAIIKIQKDYLPGTISTKFPFDMKGDQSKKYPYNEVFGLYDNGKTDHIKKTFYVSNDETLKVTETILPNIKTSWKCVQNGKNIIGQGNTFSITPKNSETISCFVTNTKTDSKVPTNTKKSD